MKNWKLAMVMSVLLLFLAACGEGNTTNSGGGNTNAASNPQPTANTNASGFPMTISSTVASTVTDEKGKVAFPDVKFDAVPKKIVVFDYGFLDTLESLGVEGITGVVKGTNVPTHLKQFDTDKYTNIGTLKTPLFEDIAAIKPDVIFISGRQSIYYEELKEIAPVVFVGATQEDYWNTFLASVDIAAKLFDKEDEAKKLLANFDAKLQEVKALTGKFNTSLVTMFNEGKLSGFASNSRFGYMYSIYGFKPVTENIAASSHGSNFGFEAVLEFNPEVLLVIDRTAATAGGVSNIVAEIENAIIKKTTAFQNKRIVYLDGPLWYLSGGGLKSELMKMEEILAELK